MSDAMQPLEIASEALRRLAMRQLQPTPENYRALYHEIAGTKPEDLFPERALKLVCSTLPRLNQAQIEFVQRLESAVTSRSWSAISGSLVGLLRAQGLQSLLPQGLLAFAAAGQHQHRFMESGAYKAAKRDLRGIRTGIEFEIPRHAAHRRTQGTQTRSIGIALGPNPGQPGKCRFRQP